MTDDDKLDKSSNRLGDRFSGSADNDSEGSENTETVEYEPTTLYLPEETRRDLRRFVKRLTLEHEEIEDAEKREMQTAMMQFAMEHPEEIAALVEEKFNE